MQGTDSIGERVLICKQGDQCDVANVISMNISHNYCIEVMYIITELFVPVCVCVVS